MSSRAAAPLLPQTQQHQQLDGVGWGSEAEQRRLLQKRRGAGGVPGFEPGGPHEKATSAAEEAAIIVKLHRHVLWPFCLLTLLNYLDRSNLAFAALELNADLGFSDYVYGAGSGVFYIGYSLFQIPANMALLHLGAPLWMGTISVAWGAMASCLALMRGPLSFYALRLLLGVAEAGAFPGMFYVSKLFFTVPEIAVNNSYLGASAAVAQVIGAPLAASLMTLNGTLGLRGWQWLFILEGLPTMAFGVWLLRVLPESPNSAAFLSDRERHWAAERMEREQAAIAGTSGVATGQWGAMRNWRTWVLGALQAITTTISYAIIYWLPLMIYSILDSENRLVESHAEVALHPNPSLVVLLSSVPFAVAAAATLGNAYHSKKTGERRLHVVVPLAVGSASLVLLALLLPVSSSAAFLALMCSTLIWSVNGIAQSYSASFLHGPAAAAGFALINSVANTSGAFGPYLIGALKHSQGSYSGAIAILGSMGLVASVLYYVLLPHIASDSTLGSHTPVAEALQNAIVYSSSAKPSTPKSLDLAK